MKKKFPLFIFLFLCAVYSSQADTIYLQDNPKGNTGEVLEEYPDTIIIRFPKSEIKRIEAEEKPPTGPSLPQVIWIEDGETITLRLPKQSVQVSGAEDLRRGEAETVSQAAVEGPAATPLQHLQEMARAATDRVIQGKVFYKEGPLKDCKVRIVRMTDSAKDQLLDMFSDSGGKEEKTFEAATDAKGIYTFTNVPYGEYILYWKPAGTMHWIRKLSENPDITLIPGHPVVNVRDIDTNVKTVN